MQVETELLLTTAPAHLERLANDLARGTSARSLTTIYFDTPDFALGRIGIAARIRQDDRGITQSVEQSMPDRSGLHTRALSESPAASEVLDVPLLRETLPADALAEADLDALQPVLRTEASLRRVMLTPAPGTRIEAYLVRGRLVAGGSDVPDVPICEVRLRLREGPRAALFELALSLERRVPLCLERRTRLDRGLTLARGGRRAPFKTPLPRVAPFVTSAEALRDIGLACLDHLNANRDGLLADEDSGYVHQMRVALRRLGSAFKVFSPLLPAHALRAPLADIRWLARTLGPLRDCDVFVEKCVSPLAGQLPGHRGLLAIQRACGRRRAILQRSAARAVGSRRYQRLVLGLGAWLASDAWHALVEPEVARALRQPARRYARVALGRRHKRMMERGKGLSHQGAAKLHRLRVATKRMRYAAGFFAGLYPERRSTRLLGVLADLQDALGGMNDCAVAERLIKEMRAGARGAMLDDAEGLLTSWNQAALAAHRQRLKEAWKALRAADRFWDANDEPDTVASRGGRRHVARHGAPADREGEEAGDTDGRVARRAAAARPPSRRERRPARARNRPRAHG